MVRDMGMMDAMGSSPHLTSFLICSQHECCGDVTETFRDTLYNYQLKSMDCAETNVRATSKCAKQHFSLTTIRYGAPAL